MNIDWKRKLTSRKFWAAVIGAVTAVLVGIGTSDSDVTKVTAIISGVATLIAYIIGEGLVDAAREKNTVQIIDTGEPSEEAPEEEPVYNMEGEGL